MDSTEINIIYTVLISSTIILTTLILFLLFFSKHKEKILESQKEIESIKNKYENEILVTQLEIQEETFKKISREIHDNISLGLTLAKLQLNNTISSTYLDKNSISGSIDLISKSLVDLNDLSKSLDAKQMVAHGLINALESEINVLNKSGIFKASLETVGDPIYLNAETDLILLRIFQEACNNIIKHANANRIDIDLIYKEHELLMKITDNGKGFDLNEVKKRKEIRKMSGLKNLEIRAELISARLEIVSYPKVGTTINIYIPIKINQHEKGND